MAKVSAKQRSGHQSEGIMGESLWQGVNIWNAGDSRSKETSCQYKSTGHEQTVVERRNTSDQEILGKEVMLLPTEIASHSESERVSSRETMTTNAARMWVERQALLVDEETEGIP